MIYTQKIHTDLQINTLEDLAKLKPFLEDGTLKVNKSQIARELGKDRRTVDKYLKGYKKTTTRHKGSPIDDYYDIIKELLSDENQQIFYYKRVLWQFLKDNHQLHCAQSSFRRYISHHPEFQEYFDRRQKNFSHNKSTMRFETPLGQQAQLDWKESIKFTLKSGEMINVNIFVLILAASRFRKYHLSLTRSQDVLFSFIDDAFETFGGVPEELLTDNMKTVMDEPRTEYSKGKVNGRFSQIVICGECGEMFRRLHWNNRGVKSIVWHCISRLESTGLECHARTINELVLQNAVVKAINQMLSDKSNYQAQLQLNIAAVIRASQATAIDSIDEKLMSLQQELIQKANSKEDYDEIADEIFRLRELRQKTTVDTAARDEQIKRINDL